AGRSWNLKRRRSPARSAAPRRGSKSPASASASPPPSPSQRARGCSARRCRSRPCAAAVVVMRDVDRSLVSRPQWRGMSTNSLALFAIVVASILIALAPTCFAADIPPGESDAKVALDKSPRHGEWIEVSRGAGQVPIKAYVVYPERKDKAPVVIVIHEIFGLTDWVRGMCDQLAEAGVIAIAPDLLSGQTYADLDGARKAISALPKEQVKADLDATSEYALTKIPAANGTLAVCGFCWGGGWAFDYATMNPKLKAAYSFYGEAVDNDEDAKKIPCPVYGFYAENDARVDATIPKAE